MRRRDELLGAGLAVGPPRRGRARTRRTCRALDDSRVTLPAPSKRVPSQWVFAVRVVAMQCSFASGTWVRPRVFHAHATSADAARSHPRWHNGARDHLLRRDRRLGHDPRDRHRSTRASPTDEVLRPLYPEEDLGPAEERFTLFLAQYWGGPTTYSDTRGHPRLRMRHAPFAVTPGARDRWLVHFRDGPRRGRPHAGAGRAVLGLRHPRRAVHGQHPRVSRAAAQAASRRASLRGAPGRGRRALGLGVEEDQHDPRPGQHRVAVADLRLDGHRLVPDGGDPATSSRRARAGTGSGPGSPRRSGRPPRRASPAPGRCSTEVAHSGIRASWKYSKYFTLLTWP